MKEARVYLQSGPAYSLRIPTNLDLQEEFTGRGLVQSPGYVALGSVPKYPALAVTTSTGFGCLTTYLNPTVITTVSKNPIGQAFSSRWLITKPLAIAIVCRTWGVDPGMMDLFAINRTLILTFFPVLTGGPEGSMGDLKLPLPPPGVLKIPVSVLPEYWPADNACDDAKDFLRVRLSRSTRTTARAALCLRFQIVTVEGPDASETLMLSPCPVLDTVRALQEFLSRQCAVQEPLGTAVLHLLPTIHAM
jgi:hypothetical protein